MATEDKKADDKAEERPDRAAEIRREREEERARKAAERRRRSDAAMATMRATIARAVKLVFVVLAAILALGALLVVLEKNVSADNPIVKFIWRVADHIDGPLGRQGGIFVFHGKNGPKWDAVVNWGLAAVIYLVIGNVLHRIIAPSGARAATKR